MADWNKEHKKVLDPFNSANICFGRFIGRNYVWVSNTSTNNIFSMVPVFPQDHPIDKNWICSDLPAPYQHPLNPSPGLARSIDTFAQWQAKTQWGSNGAFLGGAKHASNIFGFNGTLKYHLPDDFGGRGNDGKILGTNGKTISGVGVATSPGRANSFASPTKGYKEVCVQYVTEIQTPGDCNNVMENVNCWGADGLDGGCHSPSLAREGYCTSYYQKTSAVDCPRTITNPVTGVESEDWHNCVLPGYPCEILPVTDPDYLNNCSYFFPNGQYINPNCESDGAGGHQTKTVFIEGDDQEYLNPYIKCGPRYICARTDLEIPDYEMSPQNKCPVWNSKLLCTGFTCGLPGGQTCPKTECHEGSGSICPGDFLGNYCAYSGPSPEGEEDPSQTVKEWRSNGFLEFPPIHVTWNNNPAEAGFDYCTGKFKAESCCIWTENDLGEFAVSGKNWLPTIAIEQGGQCGQGGLGIGNIALQVSLLLKNELDNDCNPMCVGRDKRSLVTLPDIEYKGVCVASGCLPGDPLETCQYPEKSCDGSCPGITCSIKTKRECDVWRPEGFPTGPRWTYEFWQGDIVEPVTCSSAGVMEFQQGYVPCPVGPCWQRAPQGEETECVGLPCTDIAKQSNVPQKPRLAETIRGKMVCIENLIRDPEYSKEAWVDSNCESKEKGWCVPNEIFSSGDGTPQGLTSCVALKDWWNNKYLGPSADYRCRWVNDSPATKGAYEFTECRNSVPGETHYEDNYGHGPSIGLYGLFTCASPYGYPGCTDDFGVPKGPGECCTCMRNYTPRLGGYNALGPGDTFKSACEQMNGLYRENSRCPHGDNQTKLKNHYAPNLDIEGYRTHCVGRETAYTPTGNEFGPMTCRPGIEDFTCDGSRKPDWYCPDPLMSYSWPPNEVWAVNPNWDGCGELGNILNQSIMFTPPFNGAVSDIASGNNFSVALVDSSIDAPKHIIVWGRNPILSLYNAPNIVAESVSAGYSHILAIEKGSNQVFAWGSNANGECDIPGITLEAKQVVASSGYFINSGFSIALGMTGQIVVWGTNGIGISGSTPQYSINKLPAELPPENNCSTVFAGARCAYAICGSENRLYGWGWGVVESVIASPSFEGITNVNTLACISTNESYITDTHLFVVRGTTTTYYDEPGPPNGVSYDIIVNRVEYFAGEAFADDGYKPPNNLTVAGTIPKISIDRIHAGYNHVSALVNNGLTLGITQDVYVWTIDNTHRVTNILLANTGTGCAELEQHPIYGCGITNDYSKISSGKWHITGINNNSKADDLPFVSIWGDKNGGFDTSYAKQDIQCPFAGWALTSGITLDETGCGICENEKINSKNIQYNRWAIPANPFDPVGYLGLHTTITWLNTCPHINITGAKEESKTDPNYFNFILNDDETISLLPGNKHRVSGVDGHCRSHIGTSFSLVQQESSPELTCFEPGSAYNLPGPPSFGHSRETTYSGPCWPCPQLYDSLGTPEFLYGATLGPAPIQIGETPYYEFKIELNDGPSWTPGIWGKMRCQNINDTMYLTNDNQTSGQIAEDFESSLLVSTNPCCSASKPNFYDQVKITEIELKSYACPEIPVAGPGSELECWRCPGWQIRYNENFPLSFAWDGIHTSKFVDGITYNTGSEKYYKAARIFSPGFEDLPQTSISLPWVGVCTIMEPVERDGVIPSFIEKISELTLPDGQPNPAAGRTMCWCQSPQNRADFPNEPAGPNILHLGSDMGGPKCGAGCDNVVCEDIPYCCDIQWDDECVAMANIKCGYCSSRINSQECQNYDALKWCADKYNGKGGWTGGRTKGLDLFGCKLNTPYVAEMQDMDRCDDCRKCDLPLCRHKYNCNLKCPCGTYGLECDPTCSDITGSYGPFSKDTLLSFEGCEDAVWPIPIAIR